MKKVVVTRYGQVHYHAGCSSDCDFTAAIGNGRNHADVRNEVRKHVLKTGHECWIEAGTHTSYRLEGGRTQDAPDGAKRRLTGRNGKPTNVLADGTLDPAPPVI